METPKRGNPLAQFSAFYMKELSLGKDQGANHSGLSVIPGRIAWVSGFPLAKRRTWKGGRNGKSTAMSIIIVATIVIGDGMWVRIPLFPLVAS